VGLAVVVVATCTHVGSTAGFLGCAGMWYGSGLGLGWMASVRLQEDGSLGDDENVK
jgi:hypothetical protein